MDVPDWLLLPSFVTSINHLQLPCHSHLAFLFGVRRSENLANLEHQWGPVTFTRGQLFRPSIIEISLKRICLKLNSNDQGHWVKCFQLVIAVCLCRRRMNHTYIQTHRSRTTHCSVIDDYCISCWPPTWWNYASVDGLDFVILPKVGSLDLRVLK